jgi:hypothetical protein
MEIYVYMAEYWRWRIIKTLIWSAPPKKPGIKTKAVDKRLEEGRCFFALAIEDEGPLPNLLLQKAQPMEMAFGVEEELDRGCTA